MKAGIIRCQLSEDTCQGNADFIGGQLLVADWAPGAEQVGPPQHVRAPPHQIRGMLMAVGFESVVTHPDLPRRSLPTARKPEVCGL